MKAIASAVALNVVFFMMVMMYGGKVGAGRGNRTLLASLEGWSITTMLYPHQQLYFSLVTFQNASIYLLLFLIPEYSVFMRLSAFLLFFFFCLASGFSDKLLQKVEFQNRKYKVMLDTCSPVGVALANASPVRSSLKLCAHSVGDFFSTSYYNPSLSWSEYEGIVGWPALRNLELSLTVGMRDFSLGESKVLFEGAHSFVLSEREDYCSFFVPGYGEVFLDTGYRGGVVLSGARFNSFLAENKNRVWSVRAAVLHQSSKVQELELLPNALVDIGGLRVRSDVCLLYTSPSPRDA